MPVMIMADVEASVLSAYRHYNSPFLEYNTTTLRTLREIATKNTMK
jgi:hypothetical protein